MCNIQDEIDKLKLAIQDLERKQKTNSRVEHNGLYWHSYDGPKLTYPEALEYAKKRNLRLPLISEFWRANETGFKFEPKWYWSSSSVEEEFGVAHYFYGRNGCVGYYDTSVVSSVLCVSAVD